MNKKRLILTAIASLGILTTTSAIADLNTTFDAPPTMTSDVAATPAGIDEAKAITNLKGAYQDFKVLVDTNDATETAAYQNSPNATTDFSSCIQLLKDIPEFVTNSITDANQAVDQALADNLAAIKPGASPTLVAQAKLENTAAADAQTTITDANEVTHRLGLFQLNYPTPPPATAQTTAEKQTLADVTACAKSAGTDATDADALKLKAQDARSNYATLLAQLPGQYKTAEWWINASIQTPSQNAITVAANDVKIYNAALGYIAADGTTLQGCCNDMTRYPIDSKDQADTADQKLALLKSSNGLGYQVPTDITTEVNDTDGSYRDTLTAQTSLNTTVTAYDKIPWPAGCPSHNITNY